MRRNDPVGRTFASHPAEPTLYDVGHVVVDELVTHLNDVVAAYRADLREANDRDWFRFEARLDQRMAELRTAIAEARADTIKWMFVFVASAVLAILALG